MRRWYCVGLAALVAVAGLAAAPRVHGNGTARVRVVQAAVDAPALNYVLGGTPVAHDVNFADVTSYGEVADGKTALSVVPAAGGDPLLDVDIALDAGKDYSLITAGSVASMDGLQVPDDNKAPDAGHVRVRLLNLSPDAGAVDLLGDDVLWFENIDFEGVGDYVSVKAGRYDLNVTPTGKDTVLVHAAGTELKPGFVYTLYLMGLAAGTPALRLVTSVDASPATPTPTRAPTIEPTMAPTDVPTVEATRTPGGSDIHVYLPVAYNR
jgi:hypothetical protein